MNKKIKFSKYIFKNKKSFVDFKIQFYFNLGYKHHVSSSEIKNISKYEYTFEEKTLNQKQEIKLNNFLKELLNCFKINLIKEGLKIDINLINKKKLEFNENENSLKKIEKDFCWISAPLKKISKKNNNSNENKFSIKILNTQDGDIMIGLTNFNFNFKEKFNVIGKDLNSWGFFLNDCTKWFNNKGEDFLKDFEDVKYGDIFGLKFNSIKGEIEIFINGESKGIMFNNLDINKNYKFAISLIDNGDKVQIIE